MEKRYYNTKEISEMLGFNAGTIRNWVSQRRIPFTKFGRTVRFNTDDIEEWLKKNKIKEHNAA